MKIARYQPRQGGPVEIGAVDDAAGTVTSLAALGVGADVVAAAQRSAEERAAAASAGPTIALADVTLLAPVPDPPKFLAIGLNYQDHIDETGRAAPEFPMFFNKQRTCVNDPSADVVIPAEAPERVDYEGELGFVIGTRCRRVSRADAPGVIAGYLVVNDVSVRDWQAKAPTMTLGKSWDGHGPIGPWLVTTDELAEPHGLAMRTYVNDELRQDTTTDQMVFDVWDQIATLSTVFTLEPGDVVATGTSSGVALAMDPPAFLRPGDVVRIEVDGIGTLENTFVAES